jgi:hypothetical protein
MRNIILKQHSPMVILRKSKKDTQGEIPKEEYKKEESKSSGLGWIIAGVVVLIVLIIALIHLIREDPNAELVNAPKT